MLNCSTHKHGRYHYSLATKKVTEYINRIRSKLGKDKFIHPGARIIIENHIGEILFIERLDNGNL